MKKFVVIFLYSIIIVSCSGLNSLQNSNIDENSIVRWDENRKLNWNDFQGESIKNAAISSELLIQMPAKFNKAALFLPSNYYVECYMVKKGSWVDSAKATEQSLKYNQSIFDIYEIYSRRLRKKFEETELGIGDPTEKFNSICNENALALSNEIINYRKETEMGINNDKIDEWRLKINDMLKELEKFKSTKN